MQFVVFGLTISSSWGNGHATLWRALCRALVRRGHSVVFFERDVPYYAAARDLRRLPGGELVLYRAGPTIRQRAAQAVRRRCRHGHLLLPRRGRRRRSRPRRRRAGAVFYDLDTPVTLDRLAAGEPVYLPPQTGLAGFDLVLSYTGGEALDALRDAAWRAARRRRSMAAWTPTRIGRSPPWRGSAPTSPISGPTRRTGSGAGTALRGAGAAAAGAPLRHRRHAVPGDFPWADEHLLYPPYAAGASTRPSSPPPASP